MPSALRSWLDARLPETLHHLKSMVEINSWTSNAAGVDRVGDLTAQLFATLGFVPERVPSTHPHYGHHLVLVRQGTSHPTVAMVSHLDTVFSPDEEARNRFQWLPEGDRIYGPGTHDIKGGTALMWLTLSALAHHDRELFERTTWKLFFNSSEEVLAQDFGTVVRQRLAPDTRAALVFEAEGRSGETRKLVVARKGRGTWRATVRGRGSHAGVAPGRGANAIAQLALTLQQIHGLSDPSRDLSVNIGTVRGGSGINRVAEEAVAEGEFRAFLPEVCHDTRQRLLALAGKGTVHSLSDGFPTSIDMEIVSASEPWPRNPRTDALFNTWLAAANEVNFPLQAEARGGLSDGNLLWDFVPTLDGLGPSGDNDHCSERSADGTKLPEYVLPGSFVPKALVNVLALRRLLAE
jgi:glutamate carboxypeptidase